MSLLFDHMEPSPLPRLRHDIDELDWHRSDPEHIGETPEFVLHAMSLDEMTDRGDD